MHRSLEGNIDSKNNNKKHTNKQPGKGSKVMSGIDINIDFLVFLLQEAIRLSGGRKSLFCWSINLVQIFPVNRKEKNNNWQLIPDSRVF